jgi:hypothetical protein
VGELYNTHASCGATIVLLIPVQKEDAPALTIAGVSQLKTISRVE